MSTIEKEIIKPTQKDNTQMQDLNQLPPNAFVYIPTLSECFNQNSQNTNKGIIDMGLLSPLFLQFMAWKNLTRLNKEIKDFVTSPENSDVKKENVLSAVKKSSSHSMISVQKNTIIPNYKLVKRTRRRTSMPSAADINVEFKYSSLIDYENRPTKEKRRSHYSASTHFSTRTTRTSEASEDYEEAMEQRSFRNIRKRDLLLLEEASQYTKRHEFLYPKEQAASNDSGYADMLLSGPSSAIRRRSRTPEVEDPDMSAPEKKRLKTIERNKKIALNNKSKFLSFLTKKFPFIPRVMSTVSQNSAFATITVFSGALVVCELLKKRTVIGRSGSINGKVDLDLGMLGKGTLKVSHKHCVILWDDALKIFTLKALGENPFSVDDKKIERGDFVPLHNGSKIIIHHLLMELNIPKHFTLPSQ